ncbi:MAG TPA: hypothetical protein PLU50_09620 [Pseudobdellovibrionaceae bacterium]|nr:hypothetical protein [Pseudobdellovibrionaceae bacterium]
MTKKTQQKQKPQKPVASKSKDEKSKVAKADKPQLMKSGAAKRAAKAEAKADKKSAVKAESPKADVKKKDVKSSGKPTLKANSKQPKPTQDQSHTEAADPEVDIMSHPKLSLKPTPKEAKPGEPVDPAIEPPKPENLAPLKPSKEKGAVPSLADLKLDKNKMSDDQLKWYELYRKYRTEMIQVYEISKSFEARRPLEHKLFGWGYVLSNEYDRLEVLFKDGKKVLISNRKLK